MNEPSDAPRTAAGTRRRTATCVVPFVEIDLAAADDFGALLRAFSATALDGDGSPPLVLLELSSVESIGSAGLGRLAAFVDGAERDGARVRLVGVRPDVTRLLDAAGMGELVERRR